MDIEEEDDDFEKCLKEEHESKEVTKQQQDGDILPEADMSNQQDFSQISANSLVKMSNESRVPIVQRVAVQRGESNDESENDSIKQQLKLKQLRKRRMISKLSKVTEDNNEQLIPSQFAQVIPRLFITPPIDDCFAFGELVLEGNFKNDPFNLEKTYSWSYFKRGDCVTFSKPLDCILVDMTRRIDTEQNFEYVAQRYLNTPDQEIHQLGEYLSTYLKQTKQHLEFVNQNRMCLQSDIIFSQLKQLSKEYYEKSLKWMKESASDQKFHLFYFCELEISTMDQNYTHSGFSLPLLDLLGLDATTASALILRKGRLEFVDGYSRLARLLTRLNSIIDCSTLRYFEIFHDIMTFDDFQIPVKCIVRMPEFDCLTPENFSLFHLFFGQFLSNFSVFRMITFEINPKIVQNIKQYRAEKASTSQDRLKNAFSDFEYQIMSEVFIDKHYWNSQNMLENGNEEDKSKQSDKPNNQCGYRAI